MKISKKNGIATLPTVIVIGMMALAVVVSITALSFNELLISQGQAQSSTALIYGESGARDALVRIARDKGYICNTTTNCNPIGYYSLDFLANGCSNGTDCAQVSVSSGVGTAADPKIITSKGVTSASTRRIEVRVQMDGGASVTNGEITSAAWTELTN